MQSGVSGPGNRPMAGDVAVKPKGVAFRANLRSGRSRHGPLGWYRIDWNGGRRHPARERDQRGRGARGGGRVQPESRERPPLRERAGRGGLTRARMRCSGTMLSRSSPSALRPRSTSRRRSRRCGPGSTSSSRSRCPPQSTRSISWNAKRSGRARLCMPCHNYVYDPALVRGRELAREGKFGRITSFWMVYNQSHDASAMAPGLTIRELCIHHAYAVLFFLGRPSSVVAVSGNARSPDSRGDDQVMMVFKTDGGAIANVWGSFAAADRTRDPWTMIYKLLGTEGGFSFQLGRHRLPRRAADGLGSRRLSRELPPCVRASRQTLPRRRGGAALDPRRRARCASHDRSGGEGAGRCVGADRLLLARASGPPRRDRR